MVTTTQTKGEEVATRQANTNQANPEFLSNTPACPQGWPGGKREDSVTQFLTVLKVNRGQDLG